MRRDRICDRHCDEGPDTQECGHTQDRGLARQRGSRVREGQCTLPTAGRPTLNGRRGFWVEGGAQIKGCGGTLSQERSGSCAARSAFSGTDCG